MNTRIYKQYDSRWGSLPYPTSNSPVSSDGCGLCAVTNASIELGKYWDKTPTYFYPYMKQYAVAGHGTEWEGIYDGLVYFMGNCEWLDVESSMEPLWNELAKGNRVGIILFGNRKGPDGTLWTSSGHYVAFTDYEIKDGKHWLYMKDSGGRDHDGWFAYEDSMRGCIPKHVWTARVAEDAPKNGWLQKGNLWYYYKDGKMVKSNLIEWKGDKYYLQGNGVMASSKWIKFKVGWRYFAKNGKMLKSRWFKYKGDSYYLKGTGVMATGKMSVPCDFGTDGKLKYK